VKISAFLAAWVVAASSGAAVADDVTDLERLRGRGLAIPVRSVTAAQLADTYLQARGTRSHEALDIAAPRGTPVLAVEDGSIAKLFLSKPGGLTVYQFDPGSEFAYYYAHLDRYADGLAQGMPVRKGQVIGYVGSTGNASANAPHLHFAVFRLGPERQWWRGTPLNPFLVWRPASP
jgi:peptidoglycan LD-endopeptidase LytH